jgi:hypothetical protein
MLQAAPSASMKRPLRLVLLVVPTLLGVLSLALPGRAQTPGSGRFAFADTTLLRDTLDLRFDGLFELSDSLGIVPDTIRALSIRYRLPLARLVHLADSLAMPVDSVGAVLERERFNPLAAGPQNLSAFRYTSSYQIARTSTSWTNGGDYNLVRGPIFLRNTTQILQERYQAGGRTSLRQTRSAVTEGGWKFTPNLSMGGVANLTRFDSFDPAAISNEGDTRNEFQFSLRTRQLPSRNVTSEFNVRAGMLDHTNSQQEKRGASGDVNGRIRVTRGTWLSHDLNGQVSGNVAKTRPPRLLERLNTRDYNNSLRGTLGLFTNAAVGLNVNYSLRNLLVQTPTDTGTVSRAETSGGSANATLRIRQDSDRYLNLTGRWGTSEQASAALLNSISTRDDLGFSAEGRYALAGYTLDARFSTTSTLSEFPQRSSDGGYGESLSVNSISAEITRAYGPRFTLRANGQVSLSSFRYYLIGGYTSPPTPRESYRQSYKLEGNYVRSQRTTTGLALEVTRNLSINLPGSATAANTEVRSYRAEWRWNFRLLEGLTASQRNTLTADYTYYPFNPRSDRLNLEYGTLTTLNAVLTPRFTFDVTHNSRYQPSGDYDVNPSDGLRYFLPADETQSYSLSARMSYTPSPAISLSFQPDYLVNDRSGTDENGNLEPTRSARTLNFSGGANLNIPLGQRGRLSGDIRRTFQSNRSLGYTNGVPDPAPRGETDYWQGSLQLSWDM